MPVIVDTGPLVAFFDRRERHHRWVVERVENEDAPMFVCEPVLAEAWYLLARFPKAQDALIDFLADGTLRVALAVEDHVPELRDLIRKYRDTPMSLADACVVRMAELYNQYTVLTLDSDFHVYRTKGRTPLNVVHPDDAE